MKQSKWIILLTTLFLITGCSNETNKAESIPTIKIDQASNNGISNLNLTPPMTITSMPTINYLLPQKSSEERITPITHIVLHFTSNAAKNPENPYNPNDIRETFLDYAISAHYMIGREGEIYLLVPENRIARHAGKGDLKNFPHYKDELNKYSIGIEMLAIGTEEEMNSMLPANIYESIPEPHIGFTEAQYQSLQRLVNDIVNRNPAIKKDRAHIVGHDEYAPNRKTDPGSLFNWSEIGF
ncbi:N-acetylmuramoyl-L-alanine amidase [Sporosarcina sp. Marseille-Q4063]|uniref:N-acetylmuramoyl-L-alanine amidase n=1 Tax=Sporosarcina sp. Marseille-Q4063 TaxID=2810514 RepID=UPI001BAE6AA0|nr:N-acetylmuramoyl-L-alanine amidase [Sporosarcina sp. Marseille-Q4063]QUW21206.1 N-acetylmuramoyl-L-alanine amidase [Sporosarcina sp. Marseille-Q4063]